MENNYEVIIVGAGASGLIAAYEIAAAGKKVLILEARNRIGGRAHTIKSGELFLEAGAEFVHGDLPVTLGLLDEAKIKYHKIKGKMRRSENGRWVDDEFIENWDELIEKMGNLKNDLPFAVFLEKYFSGDNNSELRSSATRYAQGFDLVDTNKASTKELYKEWRNEDENQYRIKKGYAELMNYLYKKIVKRGGVILTDKMVKEVEWKKNKVNILSNTNEKFTAKKLLITIPVSLMQNKNLNGSINCKPAINETVNTFQQIGFGAVIKILLEFKEAFWQNKKRNISMILSEQKIPTWWAQLPEKNNLLTGWLGGPNAEEYSELNDNEILHIALKSLSVIFNLSIENLQEQLNAAYIFKWHTEPFSNGAYTYPMPGSKEARKKLNEPVDDTLFFAGEGLYNGNAPGTVEAALISGKKTASKILNSLKK